MLVRVTIGEVQAFLQAVGGRCRPTLLLETKEAVECADEPPQLFNSIMGDMSVVGSRPCVTCELGDFDTLNKRYKKRFEMKAGLTGLAQVSGRDDISRDVKVGCDNQYIDNFKRIGVIEDVKILLLSVVRLFQMEHIYEQKAYESMSDAESAKFEEEGIIRIAHLPD